MAANALQASATKSSSPSRQSRSSTQPPSSGRSARAVRRVVAATSFHWLDPEVRLGNVADALRPSGALALISTHHVAGGDGPFFAEVQRCYETWMPGTPTGLRLPDAGDMPRHAGDDFEASGRFTQPDFRRYERELTYTTREYRETCCRPTQAAARLAPDAREGLLGCIGGLIDTRFGGRIAKRHMTELAVAYRHPAA